MTCDARIVFRFDDAGRADRVFAAVHADDDAFCTTSREGADVTAILRGDSARSLLRAVDDLLACASVAEDVINEPDIGPDDAGH